MRKREEVVAMSCYRVLVVRQHWNSCSLHAMECLLLTYEALTAVTLSMRCPNPSAVATTLGYEAMGYPSKKYHIAA